MKSTIYDGFLEDTHDGEILISKFVEILKLREFEVEILTLRNLKISPCQGCFNCWNQTPGKCKIGDDGRKTTKKMAESNLIIYLTPITFGGYSSIMKTTLDRFIPNVKPYFTIRQKEIHHPFRYSKRAPIISIGVLPKHDAEQELLFNQLIERNNLNMGAPLHETIFYEKSHELAEFVPRFERLLTKVEEILL